MSSYCCFRHTLIVCHHYDNGFIEEIVADDSLNHCLSPFPADIVSSRRQGFCRRRRDAASHSPFNPVIVLRGAVDDGADEDGVGAGGSDFDLFYDDGGGIWRIRFRLCLCCFVVRFVGYWFLMLGREKRIEKDMKKLRGFNCCWFFFYGVLHSFDFKIDVCSIFM